MHTLIADTFVHNKTNVGPASSNVDHNIVSTFIIGKTKRKLQHNCFPSFLYICTVFDIIIDCKSPLTVKISKSYNNRKFTEKYICL